MRRPAGLILCGGRSTRMGQPKALLPMGSATLLEHVVDCVRAVCAPVVVATGPEVAVPKLPADVEICPDPEPFGGPLAGLVSGLSRLDSSVDLVFVTAVDAPALTPAIVRWFLQQVGEFDAAVVRDPNGMHPLCAAYRAARVRDIAKGLRDRDQRRLLDLLAALRVHWLTEAALAAIDPRRLCLRTANTPAEYAALLDELKMP